MTGIWHPRFVAAALKTLNASRWTMLLARLFGRPVAVRNDDGSTVKLKVWRGKEYLSDWERAKGGGA